MAPRQGESFCIRVAEYIVGFEMMMGVRADDRAGNDEARQEGIPAGY